MLFCLLLCVIYYVIMFQSESPTESDVNGLGIYLITSLGFVFGTLIEFAVIISLRRKSKGNRIGSISISNEDSKELNVSENRVSMLRKLKSIAAQYKRNDYDDFEEDVENVKFLRKIDFNCFFVFISGYILFNCVYWAAMFSH